MNRRDLFTWLWTLVTGLFVAGCPGRSKRRSPRTRSSGSRMYRRY